jgi:transposase/predicted transcriptional regulator
MYTKQEIVIGSYRSGKSGRQISRELGISRKTVSKYIEEYEQHQRCSENPETSLTSYLCKPVEYKSAERPKIRLTQEVESMICELLDKNEEKHELGLKKQKLKNLDIMEILHERGVEIGYTTVCNYIRSRQGKTPVDNEAFIRQQYKPGSVCEFDWGEIKLFIDGHLHRFQLAVFTSAYGNYRYAIIYNRQDTLSFMDSHVRFFSHTGGVYHQMVYDNMRVAVAKFVGKYEKEPTKALLQLKGHYQFSHRFCNAHRGNEKGHVERSVEYVRRKAFGLKSAFCNLEEAEKHLELTLNKLNQNKQQLTGHSAMELFSEERKALWPFRGDLACSDSVQLRVDKYATVSYCTNRYSVSEKLVGCFVDVNIFSNKIVIFHQNNSIASHHRDFGKHQWIISIEHYLDTLRQKPGALNGSVALESSPYLKALYRGYYTQSPRDFIDLLHYCRENKISAEKLEDTVYRLVNQSPQSVTTEKLTAILGNKPRENVRMDTESSQTAYLSKKQLQLVTKLLN